MALSRAAGVGSGSLAPEFTKMLVAVWLVPTRLNVTDGVDSSGLRPSGAVHAGGVVGIRD